MRDERVIDRLYVFARLAVKCIYETMFDDAAEYFFQSRLDPRILIRLFPDLRGTLLREGDMVNVFRGIEEHLKHAETIDDIIMANLVRNYSPIKPNVQTAPPTVELNKILQESARVMLMRYLRLVRDARRDSGPLTSEVELAVDTVYLKLLAETGQRAEFMEMFHSNPSTIVLDEIRPLLRRYGYLSLLIDIYREQNDERALLDLWTKVAEGTWKDPSISNPIGEIIQLLSGSKNWDLVQEYGLWLAHHEPVAAFTVGPSLEPRRRGAPPAPKLDIQAILKALSNSSPIVADQYLEFLVLNRNSEDRELHDELATKYVDKFLELISDSTTALELSEIATKFSTTPARGPFLLFFAKYGLLSQELTQSRLKAALFLQGSAFYDAAAMRKRFEPFKDTLLLERAILDGKLGNDRSALTSLAQLGDFSSAEAYCTLGGDVIPGKVALRVGEIAHLQEWARLVAAPRGAQSSVKRSKTTDDKRVKSLLKILIEVYTQGGRTAMSSETADLLNSQGMNLDVVDVLSSVPPSWSLSTISSFLTRSFRRSQHLSDEEAIIKGISWGQNLRVSDRVFTTIGAEGGVVEEPTEELSVEPEIASAGGEPSSFAEKVVIPGPEPVIGSVTTIDLARKEGYEESLSSPGSNDSLV
ncbi:hypothetical protein DL93DRAFT_2052874 [Clavulina sp. PMI_390]|nr:hypothetical protein DL93DRAFT_2052874 [Clavulina sp. PMI_390]